MSSDLIDIKMTPETRATLDTLKTLTDELKEKAIRTSLRAAGKPLQRAMEVKLGQHSRRASNAINITRAKTGTRVLASGADGFDVGKLNIGADELAVIVGPNKYRGKFRYIATLLETGADPHVIGTQFGSLRIGGNYVGKEVMHPGFKGTDIFGASFRAASGQIETEFYTSLQKQVDKLS